MLDLSKKQTSALGFVLLYVAFCISYIDRAAISLALPQIGKDFDLQAADLGIVISAFFLGYAAMRVPGGWLADRFIVSWTGSFDAAFSFLVMMTAIAVVVAATIKTAQSHLVPKPA